MQVNMTETNGSKVLEVEGRIDTTTAPEFEKKLLEELGNTKGSLRINLSQTAYVSSAGLRAFLNGQKFANKNGLEMSLFNVSDAVMEVLEVTGFIDILTVE